MQLSPHFSDKELGVQGCEQRIVDNAEYICMELLEPIRQHFGKPVVLHSGYRNEQHNASVGGKIGSFHLFRGGCAAADIEIVGVTYRQVFDWIRLESHLPFDKCILEHTTSGVDATVHLQIDRNHPPRRQSFVGGVGNSQQYTLVQTK